MLITDSQVHVWGADTPARPWPKGPFVPHRPKPLYHDEVLNEMDAAGVQRAIIVPPAWEGDRNDLALEAARLHPGRFAVMGRLDLAAPTAREAITGWRRDSMLGLRVTFHAPEVQAPLIDGSVDWLWAAAEQAGVPVMVYVPFDLVGVMDRVAQRHPDLRLVMDHLALTERGKGEAALRDLDKLLAIARRPNVAVKATTLPMYAEDAYPYRRLHSYVRRVYDAFGPQRLFWGSDYTQIPCSYAEAVRMYTDEIPWLSADDKEWIMGRGVCAWLGWELPRPETGEP